MKALRRAALETRVKALSLTLGPGQAVELLGASADATECLRGADLFVLPSREEGMSIALLEAMALGIPLGRLVDPRQPPARERLPARAAGTRRQFQGHWHM